MGTTRIEVNSMGAVCRLLLLGLAFFGLRTWATVDLRVSELTAECSINSLALSITFENAGTTNAGPFAVAIYASADSDIDTTDYLLARTTVAGLAAGDFDDLRGIVGLPNVVPGTYAIGAIVDADYAVAESNELNNVAASVLLELPCLHGDPDINIARLNLSIAQPDNLAIDSKTGVRDRWQPSLLIVRLREDLSEVVARAALLSEGARIVPYGYLPRNSFLIENAPRIVERLTDDPRIVQILPASRAIEEGQPTIPCPIDAAISPKFLVRGDGWDGQGRGSASLTYHIDDTGSSVDPADFRVSFEHALSIWGTYADIVFEPTGTPGQNRSIDVLWATGEHGDGTPFDGFGGIVAHSFYPEPISPETLAGDLHLDGAENWGVTPGVGLNVFSVLLHELGHCLGLNHSEDPRAVMFPQILVAQVYDGLGDDDIAGIQTLYAPAPGPNAFNISNTGANTLTIDSIEPDVASPWLATLPATPFLIPPGATQEVQVAVNFALAPVGVSTRRLLVYSNDADENPYPNGVFVDVTATGTGVPGVVIGTPSVVLTRQGPVSFPIAYPGAESITLAADDVALQRTGTARADVAITSSGILDRNVELENISGDGTLSFSIVAGTAANGHGLAPASVQSAVVVVDNTPPSVGLGDAEFDAMDRSVRIAVTYGDAAAIALAPNHVLLQPTADASAVVDVTGSGSVRREIVLSNFTGTGLLSVSIAAGSAQDAAGNPAAAKALAQPIDVDALNELPPPGPGNGTVGCAAERTSHYGVHDSLLLLFALVFIGRNDLGRAAHKR